MDYIAIGAFEGMFQFFLQEVLTKIRIANREASIMKAIKNTFTETFAVCVGR